MSKTQIEINEYNYFDIAEALHAVLTLWHDGSYGYVVLCKSQFRPGIGWRESDVENENEYFSEIESLIKDNHGSYDKIDELMDRLNEFVNELED